MRRYLSLLLFIGLTLGQAFKRNEVIIERHENGLKKIVMVFEGTGLNEIKVAEYGFYANGLKSYIKNV